MPFTESQAVDNPLGLYAATKKSNELMANAYSQLYQLSATGLSFFTVYGPWGRPDMALFLFTKAFLSRKPLQVYNEGNMVRDFTYIVDIIEGIMRVLVKPPCPCVSNKLDSSSLENYPCHRVFNMCNSTPVPLMEYISALEQVIGIPALKQFLPMQLGDVQSSIFDSSSLEAWIGFKPNTSVAYGIKQFWNWNRRFYGV